MTLSHKADVYETPKGHSDRKRPEYGFILTLICVALALVVASGNFAPAPVGSGNNALVVGP